MRHWSADSSSIPNMQKLANVDLGSDSAAAMFVKTEIVDVVFAKTDGQLLSREGLNTFRTGDAVITGATGDRWSVSRDRFNAKYASTKEVFAGDNGKYQSNPVPVLARQMLTPFTIARSAGGDLLKGLAHDWLLQYAPGDFGIVENARFQQVYRRCDGNTLNARNCATNKLT